MLALELSLDWREDRLIDTVGQIQIEPAADKLLPQGRYHFNESRLADFQPGPLNGIGSDRPNKAIRGRQGKDDQSFVAPQDLTGLVRGYGAGERKLGVVRIVRLQPLVQVGKPAFN